MKYSHTSQKRRVMSGRLKMYTMRRISEILLDVAILGWIAFVVYAVILVIAN